MNPLIRTLAFCTSLTLFVFVGHITHPVQHLACLMPTVGAQGIPSPPDGNPNHEEPGPGVYCVHDMSKPDHNCTCHRECKPNTDTDGNPTQGQTVQEDPKCRSWCFLKSCACPTTNCELS